MTDAASEAQHAAPGTERDDGPGLTGQPALSSSAQDPHNRSIRRTDRLAVGLVVASYVALAVAVYWQPWSQGPGTVIQPGGDQFANVWFLRWTPFALLGGHNPLFTWWVNVPFGVNLVTNTSAPLLGVLGAPVTLTAGPVAAFTFLSTAALAGSATAAYVFARRWVTWRPAAWICGLIYGFSPYEIGQANGHLNLTFVVLPPLILLLVHEVTVRQIWSPRRAGIALGLAVVGQFFVSSELLASTVIIGTIGVLAAAALGWHAVGPRIRRAAVGAGWAAVVAGVFLAYPVWFAVLGPGSISGPIQLVPQAYRADALGLIIPGQYTWLGTPGLRQTSSVFSNSAVENGSYLGITLVLAVVLAVVTLWKRSPIVRVAAVTGAIAWVLSLGGALVVRGKPGADLNSGLPLPERVLAHLPLLSNTIPVRYALYVSLLAGLILAIALDVLHRKLVERRTRRKEAGVPVAPRMTVAALPAIIAAACLVPIVPSIPLQGFIDPGTPSYFTSPAVDHIPSSSVALLYPYPSTPTPQGQLWQAQASMRFRMPGGYFLVPQSPDRAIAFTPETGYVTNTIMARTLIALASGSPPARTPALQSALRAQLRAWHVATVVAPSAGMPAPELAVPFLSWMTGSSPVHDGDVLAWYHVLGQ